MQTADSVARGWRLLFSVEMGDALVLLLKGDDSRRTFPQLVPRFDSLWQSQRHMSS